MAKTPLMVHTIPDVPVISDRERFIAKACENRSILHLGCAGWPLTEESLRDGTLLHLALSKVSARAFGIDLCEQGLSVLRNHGFTDLIRWDVEEIGQLSLETPPDVIVAGEILEHLSNPGLFFQGVSKLMKHSGCILIVTVPNAFSFRHFASLMFRKIELVMPDHTAYYSFKTLSELINRQGLRVREFYNYTEVSKKSSPVNRFAKRLLNATVMKVFPQLSEGIIAVVEKRNDRETVPAVRQRCYTSLSSSVLNHGR
jgi:2-polyprenyl-3-methyl-5-hydroxy-6-metoxy-1,4-benzoquinol methylase